MNNFTKISDIQTIFVDTNEEILQKNVKNFILSSLSLNNIEIKDNSKINYLFLANKKSYQIFLCEDNKIPIVFIFALLENTLSSLYYMKNFFCVYKDNKLIYFSKLDYEITIDELKVYIENKLDIKIEYSKFFDEKSLEDLDLLYKKEKKVETCLSIKRRNSISFNIYFFYLITLSFITFYLLNYEKKNTPLENTTLVLKKELIDISKKSSYKSVKYEINSLLKDLQNYKFKLSTFVYNQKNFNLTFYSKNKKDVFIFLKKYSKNIISNSIKYHKNNSYENNIIIKFN